MQVMLPRENKYGGGGETRIMNDGPTYDLFIEPTCIRLHTHTVVQLTEVWVDE